jgi:di/tricarboxylate transporter
MFVLSAALERTGVIDHFGRWFTRAAGSSERRAFLLIMLLPLVLSPFVNNTPVVVVLMPVVLAFCRKSGIRASKLLMPLSFAAILGGTGTLVGTSTNLIVDGLAQKLGQPAFGMFEITALGAIYAAAGAVYLFVLGRRLLPAHEPFPEAMLLDLKRDFFLQATVPAGSPLIGKSILESPLVREDRASVLEIRRRGVTLRRRLDRIKLRQGDRVTVRAGSDGVGHIRRGSGLSLDEATGLTPLEKRKVVLVEAIVGPKAAILGRSIREIDFRARYGALVVAMHRQGEDLRRDFEETELKFGDVLLLEGLRNQIQDLLDSGDFIALSEPPQPTEPRPRAWVAVGVMAAFVGLGAAGIDPMLLAFLGAVTVILAGCLEPSEAYGAIDWRILFLIAGMLGIGAGLESTGAAAGIAGALAEGLEPLGAVAILSAFYLLASVLTEVISNNAVAILLTPIAIDTAAELGSDPRAFLVAVMFGASASFATPIGYQTNTYVFNAGGYTVRDFLRVGLPLNLLLWAIATVCIPVFWPL